MKAGRWLPVPGLMAVVLAGIGLLLTQAATHQDGLVSGTVVDASGPLAGARVRVRATDNVTTTTADGRFTLGSLVAGQEVEVTAWVDGYYIASTHVTPTAGGITLTLRPYHRRDHPEYAWISPITDTSPTACGNCHPMILPQWQNNAHGRAVSNPRFFSIYNGTDVNGAPHIGPGYVSDFPGTAGSCASCHAPGAGVDGYLTTNMNAVRDVITAGIHCDFCHKVGGVYLDPATSSVYPNVPGVENQRVLRPPAGDQIFFGPYDDIHDPDTYLPAITQSQFCAPCHQFSFWGTPIYQSYGEWLASEYPNRGITCQTCHMPPTGDSFFARPEVGGLPHPPERIPSHLQLGATSQELLQNTVAMTISARPLAGQLQVTVTISNTGAGHHVPTDHPGRHLILVVNATDALSRPLALLNDEVVPEWGGDQAGQPGKAFAKVLRSLDSGDAPVVSYWKPTLVASDNRIPALSSDTSAYSFDLPAGSGAVRVSGRLIFRRLFADLAQQKGWDVPDIVMATGTATVRLTGGKVTGR